MMRGFLVFFIVLAASSTAFGATGGVSSVAMGIELPGQASPLPPDTTHATVMRILTRKLGVRCKTIEAFGWEFQAGDHQSSDDAFKETLDRLKDKGFTIKKEDTVNIGPDETLIIGKSGDRILTSLWKTTDDSLLLLTCASPVDTPSPDASSSENADKKSQAADIPAQSTEPVAVEGAPKEKIEEAKKDEPAPDSEPAPSPATAVDAPDAPSPEEPTADIKVTLEPAAPPVTTANSGPPAAQEDEPKTEKENAIPPKKKSAKLLKKSAQRTEKPPRIVKLPSIGMDPETPAPPDLDMAQDQTADNDTTPPAIPVKPVAQASLPPLDVSQNPLSEKGLDSFFAFPPAPQVKPKAPTPSLPLVIGDASKLPGSPIMSATQARQHMSGTPEPSLIQASSSSPDTKVAPNLPLPRKAFVPAAKLAGMWGGTYDCGKGPMGITLNVSSFNSGDVQAILSFFTIAPQSSAIDGQYMVRGRFDSDTHRIILNPQEWISKVDHFDMFHLQGSYDEQSDRLELVTAEASSCLPIRLSRNVNLKKPPSTPPVRTANLPPTTSDATKKEMPKVAVASFTIPQKSSALLSEFKNATPLKADDSSRPLVKQRSFEKYLPPPDTFKTKYLSAPAEPIRPISIEFQNPPTPTSMALASLAIDETNTALKIRRAHAEPLPLPISNPTPVPQDSPAAAPPVATPSPQESVKISPIVSAQAKTVPISLPTSPEKGNTDPVVVQPKPPEAFEKNMLLPSIKPAEAAVVSVPPMSDSAPTPAPVAYAVPLLETPIVPPPPPALAQPIVLPEPSYAPTAKVALDQIKNQYVSPAPMIVSPPLYEAEKTAQSSALSHGVALPTPSQPPVEPPPMAVSTLPPIIEDKTVEPTPMIVSTSPPIIEDKNADIMISKEHEDDKADNLPSPAVVESTPIQNSSADTTLLTSNNTSDFPDISPVSVHATPSPEDLAKSRKDWLLTCPKKIWLKAQKNAEWKMAWIKGGPDSLGRCRVSYKGYSAAGDAWVKGSEMEPLPH